MVTITEAGNADLTTICAIAYQTWPATYGAILSEDQLDYMLKLFYNEEALQRNIESGQHFLIVRLDQQIVGFASYEPDYKPAVTHIHKIYLLPKTQGKGIGRLLIDEIAARAKILHQAALSLNVNRHNKAQYFYEKLGFTIEEEVDIELDHGYLMEDYIMRRRI